MLLVEGLDGAERHLDVHVLRLLPQLLREHLELLLRRPRELVLELALQVEVERRHRADLHADVRALDVDLDELDVGELLRRVLEHRRHHDARAARLRVEVDHDRRVLGEDLLERLLVRDLLDGAERGGENCGEGEECSSHRRATRKLCSYGDAAEGKPVACLDAVFSERRPRQRPREKAISPESLHGAE